MREKRGKAEWGRQQPAKKHEKNRVTLNRDPE